MKKSAVIYRYPKSKIPNFVFKFFFVGGILGLLFLFSPLLIVEGQYRLTQLTAANKKLAVAKETNIVQGQTFSDLINNKGKKETFRELTQNQNLEILTPVDPLFSLIIPKININSRIIPEVSAADKGEYNAALQNGIAHAKGTYFPGEGGTVYLFAHSTDYIWNINRFNAVFYLVKELEKGDEIDVFYQGKHFVYQVDKSKVVEAEDVYYLKPNKNQEELVLQTCWPPGTTWKRLLVFAKLKVENKTLSYNY